MPAETATIQAPLIVEGLHKTHGQGSTMVEALKGVNFQLEPGTMTAIMGPSGSGKSSLLHCCAGLSLPSKGTVRLAGQVINDLNDHQRSTLRRHKLGMIFQSFNLVPTLSALDNIALPALLDGGNEQAAKQRASELLERVGLSTRAQHLPPQLSGGEQQRVAIARALIADAPLILADEPTGNLDSQSGESVGTLFQEILSSEQRAVGMVTHEAAVAAWADRVLILVDGQIVDNFAAKGDAATIAQRSQKQHNALHGSAI